MRLIILQDGDKGTDMIQEDIFRQASLNDTSRAHTKAVARSTQFASNQVCEHVLADLLTSLQNCDGGWVVGCGLVRVCPAWLVCPIIVTFMLMAFIVCRFVIIVAFCRSVQETALLTSFSLTLCSVLPHLTSCLVKPIADDVEDTGDLVQVCAELIFRFLKHPWMSFFHSSILR